MDDNDVQIETPKQDAIIKLDVRCGNCYHFCHQRAPRFSDVCEKIGILKIGRPCTSFLVDAHIFDLKQNEGRDLREFIGKLSSTKLALYAALLIQEKQTRRYGLRHGELVYIKIFPDDYLSNYFRAWVIMADKRRVFVQGTDKSFRGMFMPDSVLDIADFIKRRADLVKTKRLIDPNLNRYTEWRPRSKVDIKYEPMVINGVINDRVIKKDKNKTKKTKKSKNSMAQHNMRG